MNVVIRLGLEASALQCRKRDVLCKNKPMHILTLSCSVGYGFKKLADCLIFRQEL
jgi:hypothetical protein